MERQFQKVNDKNKSNSENKQKINTFLLITMKLS